MLHFSRLRILATVLIAGVICLLSLPSFLPPANSAIEPPRSR